MKTIEVVCAVIHDENGNVFIGRRKSDVADDMWEFPGGKVEAKETKEDACIREIKEELSLDIELQGFIADVYDDAFDPIIHVSAYHARILDGTLQLHAHKEGRWVKPEELYSYQFQEADRSLLDAVQIK